jgi:AcrR family transcriptional regulator
MTRPPDENANPRPTLGRRERKKIETRARILSTASGLFAEQGFDATTVEEIAEAADISRATFFTYFGEKSALVAELGDSMTDTFVRDVEAVRKEDASTTTRLASFFATATPKLEARGDLSRALLFETVGRRRDLAERKGRTARMHDAFAALLLDGVDRGDVRSDVPVSLLAEMVAGAYLEVLLTWVVDPSCRLGERLQLVAGVLEAALAPAPSRNSSHEGGMR